MLAPGAAWYRSDVAELKPGAIPYGLLKKRHPEYDAPYWAVLRALYEGGKRLLRDQALIRQIMPRYASEATETYEERLRRAYYVNLFAVVVDYIAAGLNLDPIKPIPPGAEDSDLDGVDPFWVDFFEDTAPPGADDRVPIQELVREQIRTALIVGRMWTLVDLPRRDPDASPASEADQRALGALDAYAIAVPPEEMISWEHDDNGALLWAIRCQTRCDRATPFDAGDTCCEIYTVLTREGWWTYQVEYDADYAKNNGRKPPDDKDMILPVAADVHSFGRVPAILHCLPSGLWVGNKVCSLALEHFNKSNALAYAQYKDLFAQLYEFLGPEIPGVDQEVSAAQSDPNRSAKARRGPGTVRTLGSEDKAQYLAPPTNGFEHAAKWIGELAEDVFRITYQMALGADHTGAMAARSADSRKLDRAATTVVLGSLGDEAREHACEINDAIAAGRGDEQGWHAAGLERFDVADISDQIEQAVVMEGVSIPSATYQRIRKARLVQADLGADATPSIMEDVRDELEQAITQDQFTMPALPEMGGDDALTAGAAAPGGVVPKSAAAEMASNAPGGALAVPKGFGKKKPGKK